MVQGKDLAKIKQMLINEKAISTLAPFGNSLHISGPNAKELEKALAPLFKWKGYHWQKATPSMEDAFIHFMSKAQQEHLL